MALLYVFFCCKKGEREKAIVLIGSVGRNVMVKDLWASNLIFFFIFVLLLLLYFAVCYSLTQKSLFLLFTNHICLIKKMMHNSFILFSIDIFSALLSLSLPFPYLMKVRERVKKLFYPSVYFCLYFFILYLCSPIFEIIFFKFIRKFIYVLFFFVEATTTNNWMRKSDRQRIMVYVRSWYIFTSLSWVIYSTPNSWN